MTTTTTHDHQATETAAAPRRALFVLPADAMGGAERLTVGLVEAAASTQCFDEIEVYVLARAPSGSLDHLKALRGVTVSHARARREYGALGAFARHVRGRRYELVFSTHVHINALCCTCRRLGLLRTRRLVTRESSSIFEVELGAWRHVVPLLVRLYGSQDLLIHQTSYMQTSFNRHTGGRLQGRCRVAPNPVDAAGIAHGAAAPWPAAVARPSAPVAICWCGRLLDLKRPLLAVETLRHLEARAPARFHLMFIGDGPRSDQVRQAAQQAGLTDRVTLCGQLDNPWPVMAGCGLGLITSDVEGFPNVMLEMLACGVRRVVTTNCAGDLALVPGVQVVASGSAEDLATALLAAAEQPRPVELTAFLGDRTHAALLRTITGGD
jgi:glycosyltransferase involved in cell wall biosynthesis